MPEPLKNMYHHRFMEGFAEVVQEVIPSFNKKSFLKRIFNVEWEKEELKQRIRHIATALHAEFPGDFKKQIQQILDIIERLKSKGTTTGFEYIFFTDFIEQYGLHDPATSLDAIDHDPDLMFAGVMLAGSEILEPLVAFEMVGFTWFIMVLRQFEQLFGLLAR